MFSARGGFESTTISIVASQFITSFINSDGDRYLIPSTVSNNYYLPTNGTSSISKLNILGAVQYQYAASDGTSTAFNVDGSENVYVGGYSVYSNTVQFIKYNSNGTILWQAGFNSQAGYTVGSVVSIKTDSSNNVYVLYNGSKCFLAKYNSSGTLLSSKQLIYTGGTLTALCINESSNKFIVASTYNNQIYNCVYALDTISDGILLYQQPNSSYQYSSDSGPSNMVTNSTGSILYQISNKFTISTGVTTSVITSINTSNGTMNYSKYITVNGYNIGLSGVAIDTGGYIYIIGYAADTSGFVFIGKFVASTGAFVWGKTISNNSYFHNSGSIYWFNGYIYIGYIFSGGTSYNAHAKIKDDGSLVNGIYGIYTFTSVTATLTDFNSVTVGNTSYSSVAVSLATTTPAYTRTTTTYTVNTVIL
jgi:hypothetical protein